jgi:hypothetical protein
MAAVSRSSSRAASNDIGSTDSLSLRDVQRSTTGEKVTLVTKLKRALGARVVGTGGSWIGEAALKGIKDQVLGIAVAGMRPSI